MRVEQGRKLILASASARRRKLLGDLGLSFEVVVPEVVETHFDDDPRRSAGENAGRKNAWCRARRPDCLVLSADTVVDFEGRCVAKPRSVEEARAFMRMFSGRRQKVHTGVAFSGPALAMLVRLATSEVTFRVLDEETISAYLSRVDPMDKAGAYDIDQHGDLIIESFTGSRSNIMGLPLGTVSDWLRDYAGLAADIVLE